MADTLNSTPRQDGFWMPGEFERHTQTWMLWPQRGDNWRQGAKPAQRAYCEVARAIAQFESVTVCATPSQYANARAMLPASVRVVEMSANDAWMRDCGPTFVVNAQGEVRGVDWEFNAWGGLSGGLYFPWDQDNLVAQKVLEIERLARYKTSLVMEGGALHVDGQGTVIVTEECLLNTNRNPVLSRSDIEQQLSAYLGIQTIIWLGRGVYQDETDGHVDNLCCFIRPGVVALTWTDDRSDPQYERSAEAYERLMAANDARGRRLDVIRLHQPHPMAITADEVRDLDAGTSAVQRTAGARMAASYINFYIANGGVIVPTFDDPHDAPALQTLQQLFPGHQIVPVYSREILLGGGNIHCITQQQPAPAWRPLDEPS